MDLSTLRRPHRTTRRLGALLAVAVLSSSLAATVATAAPAVAAATPLTTSSTQAFDTLAGTGSNLAWADDATVPGWYATRATYTAGSGTGNAGGLYSLGSAGSTDRALGSVASGTTGTILYGARFVNDSASTIDTVEISYAGEQWREGGPTTTPSVAQTLQAGYQTGAAGLTSGTWTPLDALDFTSPVFGTTAAALDGNLAGNRTVLNATLTGLALAPGAELWLRWEDPNDAGNDHALAIDDVVVTAEVEPPGAGVVVSANGRRHRRGGGWRHRQLHARTLDHPVGAGHRDRGRRRADRGEPRRRDVRPVGGRRPRRLRSHHRHRPRRRRHRRRGRPRLDGHALHHRQRRPALLRRADPRARPRRVGGRRRQRRVRPALHSCLRHPGVGAALADRRTGGDDTGRRRRRLRGAGAGAAGLLRPGRHRRRRRGDVRRRVRVQRQRRLGRRGRRRARDRHHRRVPGSVRLEPRRRPDPARHRDGDRGVRHRIGGAHGRDPARRVADVSRAPRRDARPTAAVAGGHRALPAGPLRPGHRLIGRAPPPADLRRRAGSGRPGRAGRQRPRPDPARRRAEQPEPRSHPLRPGRPAAERRQHPAGRRPDHRRHRRAHPHVGRQLRQPRRLPGAALRRARRHRRGRRARLPAREPPPDHRPERGR